MATNRSKLVMGVPSTMNDDFQLNLRVLYERGCRVQPQTEIVTKIEGGTHRMTYSHCQYRATKLASSLSRFGIKPGDRVGSFMWNNARHLLLYYAVPAMGAVLHTINIRLHPKELAYLIQHAEDKIIFIDADLLPVFEKISLNALTNVKKFVICGQNQKSGNWISKLPRTIDFELFETNGSELFNWPNLHDHSGMGLCYTSGTTGNPKGVLYSHRSTYIHTLNAMGTDMFSISGKDCILPIVPMFHALAWGFPFSALTLGYKLLLHGNISDPTEILNFMKNEECTFIAGVPTVMQGIRQALIKYPNKYNKIRGILTRAVCGGSAPPAELINWYWNNWNIEIIQAWGMTETNPLGSVARRISNRNDLKLHFQCKNIIKNYSNNKNMMNKAKEINDKLTSNQQKTGICVPSFEMKIVDSDNFNNEILHNNNDNGKGNSGELLVRGPYVTKKYFKINTPDKFHGNNWLVTGDIASINKDEQMIIRDRSKDMIKSGGEWISSVDMENKCMGINENIDKACVVGVKHPKWIERPIVIIQLINGLNNLENHKNNIKKLIMKTLSETYAKFQLPDDIIFWNEIPITGTGKMSKKLVRAKLEKEKYVLPSLKNIASKL